MTTPRFVVCRCTHSHHDHSTEGFAPQCTAPRCTCLQYRPASAPPGAAVPIRPASTLPGQSAPTADEIIRAGARSGTARTVKLAEKITALLIDLRTRLIDERQASEASRAAEAAKAAQRAEVAKLERQLAEAKAALKGPPKLSPTVVAAAGDHACTRSDCDRTFASKQARAMHERRAHDGFNPNKAAS